MALMLRDASQRIWGAEAPALASRCDAPQHEGEGKHQPAAVRNRGRGNFHCFGLILTMEIATPTCSAAETHVSSHMSPAMWHHPSVPPSVVMMCHHPSS